MPTKKLSAKIEGMDCPACANKIEEAVSKLEGVVDAKVIFSAEKISVTYDTGKVREKNIEQEIKKLGYSVSEEEREGERRKRRFELFYLLTVGSGILVSWSGAFRSFIPFNLDTVILVILAGIPVLRSTAQALKAKSITAEVAMASGMAASIVIGQLLSAAVIGFFMLIAEFIDDFTTDKARAAIESLIKISPKMALVKRNGREVEVNVNELVHGDVVVVRTGERIPVDGTVIAGHALVNQAPITGEPLPIEKKKGDDVYAGTINQHGTMEVTVTKVGKDTTLSRIIQLVEEAETAKAPIQKLADRFSSKFLPIVFLVAASTFLLTMNITYTISVIVVACPCAIALATPLAVVASAGKAAKKGIVIKGGIYLEELGKADTMVIDKTGTLTIGEPRVVHIKTFDQHDDKEIVTLAAMTEAHCEHPLADAILSKAEEYGIDLPEHGACSVIPGRGVTATYENQTIVFGNKELLKERGIAVPPEIEQYIETEEKQGRTAMVVAHDNDVCGAISVADIVKDEAKQTIDELRRNGMDVIMLTGDNSHTANAIARQVGITEVFAELLPERKVEKVRELVRHGRRVVMVGDGINDAPALAEAQIGIAMGAAGSDIAIEASDIALMTDDLTRISEAIRISKQTFNVIKQNLISSIIFNILGMALASIGILNPLMAALAHSLPDFILFLNSSRLIR